jgi:beta-glucosidase
LIEAFGLGNPTQEEAAAKRKADMAVKVFLDDMPVYKVCPFSEGKFTEEMLEDVLKQVSDRAAAV